MSFHSFPLFMLSKRATEATSKVLSKKKVPAAAARKKVEVRLNTTRFRVVHADIVEENSRKSLFLSN
ncbi:unnamed protein product [Spodoptera littoralis]|uniref:Uncharacterized protein n=1 Tax=Spodoptera littoralis TaxID=7109 RepID=A0A9P0I6S8_SPOLI|nr:unnamed protein product [Spodoptera littoralis]CAH1641003.1 unnamed protein product [Spodoptera littoralis]